MLNFRATNGWANVLGNWNSGVSTDGATFEAWIRTSTPDAQTIVLGSNSPGATPRISVGGDQLAVYWNAGSGPGWQSTDTTPVTDGQWHHIAVVFDQGAITFYKDGAATADTLSVSGVQQANGNFQLGAGFGSTTGFVGQLYDVRVWSTARTAGQIQNTRWATLPGSTPGLTVATTFDPGGQDVVNRVGSSVASIANGNVITTDLPSPSCALSFTGNPQDAVVFITTPPVSSGSATLECWLKLSTASGVAARAQSLFELNGAKGATRIEYLGNDTVGFYWGTTYRSVDTAVISDGQWHHLAFVFDNNVVQIYKDGVATADVVQLPATLPSSGNLFVGGSATGLSGLTGQLTDIRVWNTARTAAQISSFRYVGLQGNEPGLVALCNLNACDPSNPASMVPFDQAPGGTVGHLEGAASVVPSVPPRQSLPANVWTYPTPGISPVGPLLSPQGLISTDNDTGTTAGAFIRSVELETGAVNWSYDVRQDSELSNAVVPAAVGATADAIFVGVLSPTNGGSIELHALDSATGIPIWPSPTGLFSGFDFVTRPVVLSGVLYVGINVGVTGPDWSALAWGDPTTGAIEPHFTFDAPVDFMTEPVVDTTSIYAGTTYNGESAVTAIPAVTAGSTDYRWSVLTTAAITADIVLGGTVLYVPTGGAVLAVNTADGSTAWSHPLSSAPVTARPVLLGSTLYLGSTDGILYALDAATGAEQWRVDTGSPIVTDLVNDNGILYFANQGNGSDNAPAFIAVDTLSQGNDVLQYLVPAADTILFVQGGVTNGIVYFYGSQDVYAVNMSNVIREFAVNSKLIVENYDTTTPTNGASPTGTDTSYRVTLTVRDENGLARPTQAVKVWSAGPLYVNNQSSPVALGPDTPVWMETDSSGNLTLAISAFDDGTPSGSPNVSCPAVFVWSNFMAPGEAVVIYPDHEQLGTLANVQGTSPQAATAGAKKSGRKQPTAAAPAAQYLDQATAYDGSTLISASFQDANSLAAIASTVRNTIGTRNIAKVGATRLAPDRSKHRYVRAGAVIPNVVYAADASASSTRPYVPGVDATFTVDLSSGLPVYTAGTFDDARPKGLKAAGAGLGGIFSDIKDFESNVVKGAENVAKLAWQFTENAVQTVIHTAESVYNLVITDVEDAVTAVVGFLKAVVADIVKVIQWLSALFDWKNILNNHTYLKNTISNPGDPTNPGSLDRMLTWVNKELAGGTDTTATFAALSGHGSTGMTGSAQNTAGQTVGSQQSGNNDSNSVYNTGGNNNANQCTWMQQKTTENSTNATTAKQPTAVSGAFDPGTIDAAFQTFLTALQKALASSFADLPAQIQQKLAATQDSFKDPKSLLSAGISDLIAVFASIADDLIEFAEAIATDFLQLLSTLLDQISGWLTQPIELPFVSELYHAMTGNQLTLLDLTCLLAAVPATILLDAITGSPVVAITVAAKPGDSSPEALAGLLLIGIAGFCLGEFGTLLDIFGLDVGYSDPTNSSPVVKTLLKADFGVDLATWALGSAFSFGSGLYTATPWEPQDYVFWGIQLIPQAFNFANLVRGGTFQQQAVQDSITGVAFAAMAGVYAYLWPASYLDAPKVKGLALVGNVFNAASLICEVLFVLLNPEVFGAVLAICKLLLFTVGNVLSFTDGVLTLVA